MQFTPSKEHFFFQLCKKAFTAYSTIYFTLKKTLEKFFSQSSNVSLYPKFSKIKFYIQ